MALLGETITNVLLAFGIGLPDGRNIHVYQRKKMITAGKETAPQMP